MKWKITYYNESVQKGVLGLPKGLLVRYLRLTDVIQACGPNLGMPHTRALNAGLFEMRVKAKEGIARAFYCVLVGREIVVLHSIVKKSQKAPTKDLALARKRMKEVLENG